MIKKIIDGDDLSEQETNQLKEELARVRATIDRTNDLFENAYQPITQPTTKVPKPARLPELPKLEVKRGKSIADYLLTLEDFDDKATGGGVGVRDLPRAMLTKTSGSRTVTRKLKKKCQEATYMGNWTELNRDARMSELKRAFLTGVFGNCWKDEVKDDWQIFPPPFFPFPNPPHQKTNTKKQNQTPSLWIRWKKSKKTNTTCSTVSRLMTTTPST